MQKTCETCGTTYDDEKGHDCTGKGEQPMAPATNAGSDEEGEEMGDMTPE